MYPEPVKRLISAFRKLPSVGQRTAERFVFHLLKSGKKEVSELVLALKNLEEQIKSCQVCWDFSLNSPCGICANPKRDTKTICVVGEPQDLQAIEKLNIYNGLYHVSRGVVSADDPAGVMNTKIPELLEKIRGLPIHEVILALNPTLSGETTMLFLEQQIKKIKPQVKVSRLARGLPTGSDIEYADDITLENAFKNRVGL